MVVEEKRYDTAREFLEALRITNPCWTSEEKDWESSWIFRGQPDADLRLIPSAWRSSHLEQRRQRYRTKFERMRSEYLANDRKGIDKQVENEELTASEGEAQFNEFTIGTTKRWELALHYFVEMQAIKEFIEFADRLGYPVSGVNDFIVATDIPNYLGLLDEDFLIRKCLMVTDHNNPFNVNSSAVALAQHHGVPTRLLDWTEDPLIAAFFAADEAKSYKYANNKTHQSEHRIAVWALSKTICSNNEIGVYNPSPIQLINRPRHDIAYLFAQKGVFTVDKRANDWFNSTGTWPFLEEVKEINSNNLRKLTLPVYEAEKLLQLLWIQGISRAHLMPTIDNVTRALQDRGLWENKKENISSDASNVDKAELLRRMDVSYQHFEDLLSRAVLHDVDVLGVTEAWSVKDMVAHLIAHEQRTIAELQHAKRGEHLAIKHEENDSFNDGAVYACRPMPFEVVRDQWRRSYGAVVKAIQALDEADFDAQSEVVRLLDDSIDGAVANNTYEHYDYHGAQIEAWLAKQSPR